MGLRDQIRKIYRHGEGHAFNRLWTWAKQFGRKSKIRRFEALKHWASDKAQTAAHPRKFWKARRAYKKELAALQSHSPSPGGWPDHITIVELFNNDNALHNHLHVASPERDKLIQLAHIAANQYGGEVYVREFPPFDPVECVHVSTSWHYRDSSNPYTPRTCAGRGNGCAFDFGSASRDYFGRVVKARYGAASCDF